MTEPVSRSEAARLGRRGSYRPGRLGAQGIGRPVPSKRYRPSFTRPRHRGPLAAWILAGAAGTALIAGGAALGLWFLPFLVGVAAGIVARWGGWRLRVTGSAVLVMAAAGWGLAMRVPALGGLPIEAVARAIAALAGLPASALAGVAVALAVSMLQGVAGLCLGRAIAPRPVRDFPRG